MNELELERELDRWRILGTCAIGIALFLGGILVGRAAAPAVPLDEPDRSFTLRMESLRTDTPMPVDPGE